MSAIVTIPPETSSMTPELVEFTNFMSVFSLFSPLLFVFILLDLVLKGFSLWRASQRKEKVWFIALLLINSLGIFPAIYLLTHRHKK